MPVTRFEDLDLTRQYTYADYVTWEFKERVELLRGWIARTSPAPNTSHQRIATEFTRVLGNFLHDKPCYLFAAPFDVRLPRTDGGDTVVQPDLCVVCDREKLTEQGCAGAPDWAIEIVIPGDSKRELGDKYALYEESGVREYWVINPLERTVLRYESREGTFVGLAPRTEDSEGIASATFPEFSIAGAELFVRL